MILMAYLIILVNVVLTKVSFRFGFIANAELQIIRFSSSCKINSNFNL